MGKAVAGNHIAENQMASRALDALTLGVVVTDRQCRRVYSNAEADRLLAGRGGALHIVCGNKIGAACRETQRLLHAAVERACARPEEAESHHIPVLAADDTRPDLAACVTPVAAAGGDGAAMILLRVIELECNVEIEGRRLFGLTRTEAKFASAIASGLSLAEAARTHGVGLETARFHMKGIFRKTGVCRQSQVVALMRGAQMPVRTAAADVPRPRRYAARQDAAPI